MLLLLTGRYRCSDTNDCVLKIWCWLFQTAHQIHVLPCLRQLPEQCLPLWRAPPPYLWWTGHLGQVKFALSFISKIFCYLLKKRKVLMSFLLIHSFSLTLIDALDTLLVNIKNLLKIFAGKTQRTKKKLKYFSRII